MVTKYKEDGDRLRKLLGDKINGITFERFIYLSF